MGVGDAMGLKSRSKGNAAEREIAALEITAKPSEKPDASRAIDGAEDKKRRTLPISRIKGETDEQAIARAAASPIARAAVSLDRVDQHFPDPSVGDRVIELVRRAAKVHSGDMSDVEAMLMSQASVLESVFYRLLEKGLVSGDPERAERWLRQAFAAQRQSRASLETLAEIKNPRHLVITRQANIAQGHQQVNNGVSAPARAHEENREQSNELLERSDGKWLDTGAAGTTGRGDQALEAVGAVNRARDR